MKKPEQILQTKIERLRENMHRSAVNTKNQSLLNRRTYNLSIYMDKLIVELMRSQSQS